MQRPANFIPACIDAPSQGKVRPLDPSPSVTTTGTGFGNQPTISVNGQHYYNGVDLIPNRPLYLHGKQYPGDRIINGGPDATAPAFVLPDGAQPGNAPRNLVRGFDAIQTNIAIRKEVPIHDRFHIQLRAESFNLFNHPNFGYIDPSLSNMLFGHTGDENVESKFSARVDLFINTGVLGRCNCHSGWSFNITEVT